MKKQELEPNVYEFNGFTKGVIGKKLPSDSTMLNMKKKELIELLYIAQHNYESLMWFYNNAVNVNIEKLAKLEKYNWTSCKECLPKKDGKYLCYVGDGKYAIGTYTKEYGWVFGTYVEEVIAWQPLPNPYEDK